MRTTLRIRKTLHIRFVPHQLAPLTPASPPSPPSTLLAASNVFSLGQTMLLKVPAVKKVLGLPDLSKLGKKPDVDVGKPVTTFDRPPRPAAAAVAEAPAAAAEGGAAGAAPSKPQFATRRPAKTYSQPPRPKKK